MLVAIQSDFDFPFPNIIGKLSEPWLSEQTFIFLAENVI